MFYSIKQHPKKYVNAICRDITVGWQYFIQNDILIFFFPWFEYYTSTYCDLNTMSMHCAAQWSMFSYYWQDKLDALKVFCPSTHLQHKEKKISGVHTSKSQDRSWKRNALASNHQMRGSLRQSLWPGIITQCYVWSKMLHNRWK